MDNDVVLANSVYEYSIRDIQRCYNTRFGEKYPDSVLHCPTGRWVSGMWVLGNNYRNKSKLYGAFPPGILNRIYAMFPFVGSTLHVFSGSLSKVELEQEFPFTTHTLLDINPVDKEGVIVTDAEKMISEIGDCYDFILADPPYDQEDAKKYGYPSVNKKKVLYQCYECLNEGGFLCWLDTRVPMFRKDMFDWIGAVGVIRSTNHRVRVLSIFRISCGNG